MGDERLADLAHLMRRAGFGASKEELEEYAKLGYDAVVDMLVEPESVPDIDVDILERYYFGELFKIRVGEWFYRMLNSRRQLQEKMALFWHHVFATGLAKNEHMLSAANQIATFRRVGLSNLDEILNELSRDPAMIFWLDNNENRKGEPNENYGRELLELFSMGVGNYTEQDIKMASRAFTGWTFTQPIPLYPHGYYPAHFIKREDDHDNGDKTFLGSSGNFDGEDIISIIVQQPATAVFISRHLYNFFVADEPQVPAWPIDPPQDPEAIRTLVASYFASGGEMREVMRTLFKSDFFKQARFAKVKSPTELVMGVLKLVGTYRSLDPDLMKYADVTALMGQELLNPPTVEGWHTGREWIDGGTMNERVNFAVDEVSDATKPGIRETVDQMEADAPVSADGLVDRCLELAGRLEVGEDTRTALRAHAGAGGDLDFDSDDDRERAEERVVNLMRLIVSTTEYQFA